MTNFTTYPLPESIVAKHSKVSAANYIAVPEYSRGVLVVTIKKSWLEELFENESPGLGNEFVQKKTLKQKIKRVAICILLAPIVIICLIALFMAINNLKHNRRGR